MGLLYPPDRDLRAARIAAMASQTVAPITANPTAAALEGQLTALRTGLRRQSDLTEPPESEAMTAIADRIGEAINAGHQLGPAERETMMDALHAAFLDARTSLRDWLDEALAPIPLAPSDLPAFLREQWAPNDEQWLLRIFPAADPEERSILHPDRLGPFIESLRSVLPNGTGNNIVLGPPVQILESSLLIQRAYTKAAAYAVFAILIVLLIDFRSLADALCSMLPVSIGFIGVFGMLGLTGLPLNFANIIVMPLIFGIGVDAGVHMVHRWRQEPFGRPAGLSGATGRGITLTMLTTMIGFGCMLLAQHRGIRSLGFVMIVGLSVTLAACYLVLPAVLRLRLPHDARCAVDAAKS
jgi:hypothetical protein